VVGVSPSDAEGAVSIFIQKRGQVQYLNEKFTLSSHCRVRLLCTAMTSPIFCSVWGGGVATWPGQCFVLNSYCCILECEIRSRVG